MRRHGRVLLLVLFLAGGGPLACGADNDADLRTLLDAAGKRKVQPLAWVMATAPKFRQLESPRVKSAHVDDNNQEFICLNVLFDDAESCHNFKLAGSHVLTRFDRFMDVFLPSDNKPLIDEFFNTPGLKWIEVATTPILPPPARPVPSKEKPRAPADKIIAGGLQGLTGSGVVVAVIDSGLDFHHPDFITYDANNRPTSRVLYFWDTLSDGYAAGYGSPGPFKYPNGAPIGTVYSRDDLNAELRGGRPHIVEWDSNGHGTGCAGIATGNGNASGGKRAGVAPKADIIAVRIGGRGSDPSLENSYLLNAIAAWLDETAGKRPLVVSCSYGGHTGAHDGSRIEEQHLTARFAADRPGRAICIAAGNEGHTGMHGDVDFGPSDEAGDLVWSSQTPAQLTLYVDTEDADDIQISADESLVRSIDKSAHGLSPRTVVELLVNAGDGKLQAISKSGKKYSARAYLSASDSGAAFSDESRSELYMVGTPATALGALAVGSYNWNDQFDQKGATYLIPDVVRPQEAMNIGSLSGYSNAGYLTSDGRAKPDIVAPGQWYAAPAAMNSSAQRDSSGHYQLFNGTSAATPYVAGVVALLMEKKPTLSLGEVRTLLSASAASDQFVGKSPNPSWGYGKLNVPAVERMVRSLGSK